MQDEGAPVIMAVDTRADLEKLAEVLSEPTYPILHKGKAKAYQVKQVLLAIERLEVDHGFEQ
jgi:hypothetical protein